MVRRTHINNIVIDIKKVSKMDKNYYELLGLRRNAGDEEIADSYRKLVLRWHPKFAKQDHATAYHHFSEISEAYEVLSDPLRRAFYDRHGWRKLKEGLFMDGELKGGYRFGNNPDQIFERFFESNNVFAKCLDQKVLQKGSIFSNAFGALNYKDTYPNEDLEVVVPCTLEELYQGVAKKVTYQRKGLNLDGRTLQTVYEQKLLNIKPGLSSSSTIAFPHQGHESISRNRSNLLFKIVEIPQPLYSRSGDDLIYTANITLAQALACTPIQLRTLDDRVLRVSLDEIPNPQVLKQVRGEGMPIIGTGNKGDLYIRFNIIFPTKIPQQAKGQLRALLGQP